MMRKIIKSFIVVVTIVTSMTFMSSAPVAYAQTANYSCGSYGAGNYSQSTCTDNVKPPNTGFAKLMQPDILMPSIGSALVLAVGITIVVVKLRKRNIS